MADTYVRIRKYLRGLGETNLGLFRVQYENGQYTIADWNYTNRVKPIFTQLNEITQMQISDERKEIAGILHSSDIYTFINRSTNTSRVNLTVVRQDAVSILFGGQIKLSNLGYYKITVTGTTRGDLEIKLMHATSNLMHIEKALGNDHYFNFTAILKTTASAGQENVSLLVLINRANTDPTAGASGTILVEFLR